LAQFIYHPDYSPSSLPRLILIQNSGHHNRSRRCGPLGGINIVVVLLDVAATIEPENRHPVRLPGITDKESNLSRGNDNIAFVIRQLEVVGVAGVVPWLAESESQVPPSDATVTLTNLGDQGSEAVYGVIYPPQVALVAFGRLLERPWAEAGEVRILPVVTASLSADHRVTDGHRGALFLLDLRERLQRPHEL